MRGGPDAARSLDRGGRAGRGAARAQRRSQGRGEGPGSWLLGQKVKAFQIRESRTRHPQPMAFLGPLGKVLFGDARGTSYRAGLRAGRVSPNHPRPHPAGGCCQRSQHSGSNFTLAGGTLESASLAPHLPAPAAGSAGAQVARSVPARRARAPGVSLPMPLAAPAPRGGVRSPCSIQPGHAEREKRRGEVATSGNRLCAGEGALSGGLGLGRGETGVYTRFACPLLSFPRPR